MAERDLYSLDETGGRLGVSRTTVKKMLISGELISVKIGRRRMVPAISLQRWMDKRTAEAEAQLQPAS
jgi:excisionase family DNA binding protein